MVCAGEVAAEAFRDAAISVSAESLVKLRRDFGQLSCARQGRGMALRTVPAIFLNDKSPTIKLGLRSQLRRGCARGRPESLPTMHILRADSGCFDPLVVPGRSC